MADVYFRQVKWADGTYWQLYGVRNVKPEERSGLSLDCQEYLAISGDIGSSTKQVDTALGQLRADMEKAGHTLHYDQPAAQKIVDAMLVSDPYEQMQEMAERWFKTNVRKVMNWPYEIGFGFYLGPQGKVGMTAITQGQEAEVDWPDGPEGTISIGGLHTHVGSDASLSEFDQQEGQKEANKTGRTYVMYVVGPSQMDEGWELNQEEFEPVTMEAKQIVDTMLEGSRDEYLRSVIAGLNTFQRLLLDLDVAVTGVAPERAVSQYHHLPNSIEKWIEQPGGNPMMYLADGGYSRVVWGTGNGDLWLTSNSTSTAKANWEKALPQREAFRNYCNTEYKRLLDEYRQTKQQPAS